MRDEKITPFKDKSFEHFHFILLPSDQIMSMNIINIERGFFLIKKWCSTFNKYTKWPMFWPKSKVWYFFIN